MKAALIVTGIVVAVVVIGFIALMIRSRLIEIAHVGKISRRVDEVLGRLDSNGGSIGDELLQLAADPETRNTLYGKLESSGRKDLFPAEFDNPEAFAESNMVFWLRHPNELDSAPTQIELAGRIRRKPPGRDDEVEFFVFRFRVSRPHWAAERGWMAGITWPDPTACKPEGPAYRSFSELEPYDSKTPADHVDYLLSKRASFTVR